MGPTGPIGRARRPYWFRPMPNASALIFGPGAAALPSTKRRSFSVSGRSAGRRRMHRSRCHSGRGERLPIKPNGSCSVPELRWSLSEPTQPFPAPVRRRWCSPPEIWPRADQSSYGAGRRVGAGLKLSAYAVTGLGRLSGNGESDRPACPEPQPDRDQRCGSRRQGSPPLGQWRPPCDEGASRSPLRP